MTETLQQLIGAAMALAGDHPCSVLGHDWKSAGGRACPHYDTEKECGGSQAVYECARCPEIDYGDPGGPGYRDCFEMGPCNPGYTRAELMR